MYPKVPQYAGLTQESLSREQLGWNKITLQCFGHLMRRADSFEKTRMLGKIEGGRRRGQQRMRWLDGITDLMDVSLSASREPSTVSHFRTEHGTSLEML